MIELLCSRCETANAVAGGPDAPEVRCASCRDDLDGAREVTYFVADHPLLEGPQTWRDLRRAAQRGFLRPEAWISEEGGPWFRGREREALFAGARGAPAAARALRELATGRRSAAAHAVPGGVRVVVVLDRIVAVLLFVVAIPAFAILSSFAGGGAALLAAAILCLPGWALLALAKGLSRGSAAAQVLQLVLAGLVGVWFVGIVAEGAPPVFTLLGACFVLLPFLLLLSEEARAFFRGQPTDEGPPSTRS